MKKLQTRFVNYLGIDFLLEGKHYKMLERSYFTAEEPEEFDIHRAFIGEQDVMDILSTEHLRDLQRLALEEC